MNVLNNNFLKNYEIPVSAKYDLSKHSVSNGIELSEECK